MSKIFNNDVCDNCKYCYWPNEDMFDNECQLTIFDCPNVYNDLCFICSRCPYKSMCKADTLTVMVKNG